MCGRQPHVVLFPLQMRMQWHWQNLLWPQCIPACSSQPQFLRRMSSCTAQSCCLEFWSHRSCEFRVWRWYYQNHNPWRWSGVFFFYFCLVVSGSSLEAWLGCGPSQSCRGLSAVAASFVPAVVAVLAPEHVSHTSSLSHPVVPLDEAGCLALYPL